MAKENLPEGAVTQPIVSGLDPVRKILGDRRPLFISEAKRHQWLHELETFSQFLRQEKITSYLEIGSKYGCSLWRIGLSLPPPARLVAVDLPSGTKDWTETQISLRDCVAVLNEIGHQAQIIWGDSTGLETVTKVRRLAPFDAVFIDANHARAYVEKDWANYGPMARIVAFHDISWKRDRAWQGTPIDVGPFWDIIKPHYQHCEFRSDPSGRNNGIGVLWRK